MGYTTWKIRTIRKETSDTKTFVLESDQPVTYQPGQFVTLVLKKGEQEIRRPYSFSSHPKWDPLPFITVKRIPNGEMSRWLCDEATEGEDVSTSGVSGMFTLPPDTTTFKQVLLLAAGSGITPLFSILKEVLRFHPHLRVLLIYSNRSESSTIFLDELKSLARTYPSRLTIEFLFSDAKNLRRARLGKYVLEEILQQQLTEPREVLSFICGPLDYRQMVNITLLNEGIPASQIRKEIFHTPTPRVQPEPPDKLAHQVTLLMGGDKFTLSVQYPQTILQAAREAQIELPYSCEAGRCGTCAATCVKGNVWMARNEVLLDKELEKGRVLTCTGYPIGGDIQIIFERP